SELPQPRDRRRAERAARRAALVVVRSRGARRPLRRPAADAADRGQVSARKVANTDSARKFRHIGKKFYATARAEKPFAKFIGDAQRCRSQALDAHRAVLRNKNADTLSRILTSVRTLSIFINGEITMRTSSPILNRWRLKTACGVSMIALSVLGSSVVAYSAKP